MAFDERADEGVDGARVGECGEARRRLDSSRQRATPRWRARRRRRARRRARGAETSGEGRGRRAARRARADAARGDDGAGGALFWIHTARARTTLGDVARAHGCEEETLMRFNVGGAIEAGTEVLIPCRALAPRAATGGATTRRARGFEEGARATGARVDWVHAVFFFAGLGIGLCVFGERGVWGRARTRARDEGARRGGGERL